MDGQDAYARGVMVCQGRQCDVRATTKVGLSGTLVVRILAGAITDEMGQLSRASDPLYVAGDNWTVSVSDASATEGTDDSIDFEVSLNARDDCREVSVDWATADGTAIAGEDYTGASETLTFAPGETSKTISVAVLDDTVSDSGETFTLRLSNVVGHDVELGSAEATGTILNDEENETGVLPVVSIAASTTPVTEGTTASFTLSRTGATDTALTVDVAVGESGAVVSGTAPTSVTFAESSATATLSVATEDDEVSEDASTVTATVSSGTGYTVGGTSGSADVVVNDDDASPVVTTASPIEVAENGTAVATLAATDADTAASDLS
ncbi:MAG: hypothetical protein OXC29_17605, partial [Rhodococcus sp.]|nr:hypothetical protein [Rhodococcus sp. (in: high G+C Gram-positive bacteria)]